MQNKTIFSGVQPTGNIHIGNLIGAIIPFVKLQEEYKNNIYCVVDYHAITVKQDPIILKRNILNIAKIYLSCGVDPKKSTIFVQSAISEHTELGWILNTIAKISEMERMTQYKDKAIQHKENVNIGLFDYPVLMAADILLYGTDIVPVGEDQLQHVELARTLAERFNNLFGKTFTVPTPLVQKIGSRIMGLDNPAKKMSKSAESSYNYISIFDSAEEIKNKLKKAVTDSGTQILFSKESPAIYNLLTIYQAFTNKTKEEIEQYFKDKKYSELKEEIAKAVIEKLIPLQEKIRNIDDKKAIKILEKGAKQAKEIAEKKLQEVKEKMGIGI